MERQQFKSAFLTILMLLSISSFAEIPGWQKKPEMYTSWVNYYDSTYLEKGYRYTFHVYETGWKKYPDERWYNRVLFEKPDETEIYTFNDLTPYDTAEEAYEKGEGWYSFIPDENMTLRMYMHKTIYVDHLSGHVRCEVFKYPTSQSEEHIYTMSSYPNPGKIPADGTSYADIFVQLYRDGLPYSGECGSEGTEYVKITTDKGSFSSEEDVQETWMFYSGVMGSSVQLYSSEIPGDANVTVRWHGYQDTDIVHNVTVTMGDYSLSVAADTETLPADGSSTSEISVSVNPFNSSLGDTATLTADRGSFANGMATIDVLLDEAGQGTASFTAPLESGFCHITGQYGDAKDTTRILAQGYTLLLSVSPDTIAADEDLFCTIGVRLVDGWFEPATGESITLATDKGTFENGASSITVTSTWSEKQVLFHPPDGQQGIATITATYLDGYETIVETAEITLFTSKLILQPSPGWLEADGEDEGNLMVSLFLGGEPAEEDYVIFVSTDKGYLRAEKKDGTTVTGATLALETSGGGFVNAVLVASEDPGLATVTAEYLPAGLTAEEVIPMAELEIDGQIIGVHSTGVPAQTVGETESVPRKKVDDEFPPEVTLYGSTEVKMQILLSDTFGILQDEFRPITLICPQKASFGSEYITLPENGTTDGDGIFEFTLSVKNLYNCGESLDSITVTAVADTLDPPLQKDFNITVVDNLQKVLDIYMSEIKEGPVVDINMFKNMLEQAGLDISTQQKTLELCTGKGWGHLNNTMSSILFDWVPGGWNNGFDSFVCGAYQQQVLFLLDALRLNRTTYKETSWMLNGLDYAPLGIGGGCHLAAMIYPRISGANDWARSDTIVLDPWLTQTPQSYTWDQWYRSLYSASLTVPSIVVHPWSLYGNSELNKYYPANGKNYPPSVDEAGGTRFKEMYESLLIDCPVNVVILDKHGRMSGYDITGTEEGIFKYEIPDLWRSTMQLEDGTTGWYFELPKDVLDITISGYDPGEMTITRIGSGGKLRQYRQITVEQGESCHLLLDPNHPDLEVLVTGDGTRVLSDDSIAFGTWTFDSQNGTSSAQLIITNTDTAAIYAPMIVTVDDLLPTGVSITDADGTDGAGNSIWNCDSLLTGGQLQPGETIIRTVSFTGVDPNGFDILVTLQGYADENQNSKVICTRKDFGQGTPQCGDDNHPYPNGDVNRDCAVNQQDFALLADQWLNDECPQKYDCWNSDTNQSGMVDIADLLEFAVSWLNCTHPDNCL